MADSTRAAARRRRPELRAGGLLMAYLAANASLVSFQMTRTGYWGNEETAARCAQQRGDVREAARHYANVVSTYTEDGWWQKNPQNGRWPVSFPFVAFVFRHAWAPGVLEHRMPRVEATYRVRLANLLIEDGRAELGAKQLARAAELWGQNGEERVKTLREQLPRIDASVSMPVELCRSSDPAPR